MKRTIIFGLLIVLTMCFTSCDDDNRIPKSKLTVEYLNPEKLKDFKATDLVLNVSNLTSGQTSKFNMAVENEVLIEEGGLYIFC